MKILFAILICLMLNAASVWADPTIYNLKVTIRGIQTEQGNIRVALFDKEENFLTEARLQGKNITAQEGAVEVIFTQLESKTYAVVAYQDLNKNKKLNKNFFGVPKEPLGFSQGAISSFGPPDFQEASFLLKGNLQIEITLH